jgi:hypothetical protein
MQANTGESTQGRIAGRNKSVTSISGYASPEFPARQTFITVFLI